MNFSKYNNVKVSVILSVIGHEKQLIIGYRLKKIHIVHP